ncbi:MAG: hypothetical protein H6R19_2838 [Proteobacteria bacterium]|nr:hypothetical protein [Pseudomonadota bacterium]
MAFHKIGLALLGLAFLAGCAVGPDYRKPVVTTPDQWQIKQSGKLSELQDWWARFEDPSLNTLLVSAQKESTSLAKATAAIEKARASRMSAESGFGPTLDASADATSSGSLKHNGGVTHKLGTLLDASWELDLFGKTRRSMESADALIAAREADWHDARISLAAEVVADYVDYRACRIKQKYYEEQVESQTKTTELTRIAANAGFTAAADARLAEASEASTRATARAQKTECEVLVKTLVALTNIEETSLRTVLRSEVAGLPEPIGLRVDSVPANLLRQRPDVVAAERALASASALIGVAEAARWPTLTLSGSVGISKTQGTSLSAPWSFGPALKLPIFDGGSISASIKSAKADYDSALATYQQTIRDAVKEVEQSLTRLDNVSEREEALSKSAEGYRAYLIATEQNWRAGGVSQLDLETARRSAISAEVSLLELQQNRLSYWIALYKAVGGGWQAEMTKGDAK